MHTLVNRTVRELAREYFNGQLAFEDYRNKRQRLIDQLTGVETDVETEAEDATLPHAITEDAPACDVSAHQAGQEPVCETKRFPLPVILLLLVGGLAAAGWFLFPGKGQAPQEPVARTTPKSESVVAQIPTETSPAVHQVSEFVQADDWSNDALANLVLAWGALDMADQERARSAPGFRLLVEGLREQILEQRALGDMADADEREVVLMSVAEHLGVLPLLADLQQTVIDMGKGSKPVAKQAKTSAEVRDSAPLAEVEPAQKIVQPAEAHAVAAETVPEKPLEETVPLSEPATPAVTKRAVKPAVKPAPEPATSPAQVKPAPEPVPAPAQVKPAPAVLPAKAVVASSGKDPCPASLAGTRRPVCRDTLLEDEPGPLLVVLPAGSFQMGSQRKDNEQPVHRVEIDRPFAISAYEVSRADYQRFCRASGGDCPAGHWNGKYDPMTNVSWNEARAYVEWLSQVTGRVYRLPSEAEWEYAARAGTKTDYPFGEGDRILPSDARFNTESPLPVNDRSVNTNGFRLRHIMGNAREWVADVWQENYRGAPGDGNARLLPDTGERVVRGGSYADDASRLRSAARSGLPINTRDRTTGFRVVREVRN